MSVLILAMLILGLLLLRQPVMVILGAVTAYCYAVIGDGEVGWIIIDAWEAANRELLLSIPLYVLAGNIMSRGAMATRLIRVSQALTAPVPGGLAIATVISCALFAAVSGSGTVTLLAIGGVMYPALIGAGYPRAFSLGLLCAGGTLGIIIPPSIPLILYGVMTQTSVTGLFIAGIGPGLLLVTLLAGYSLARHGHIRTGTWQRREITAALRSGVWSLFMPALILGGIYSGYFTATESAAVAVVYAMLVETLIHRQLGPGAVYAVIAETVRMLGALFPVLMLALSLNVFLTYEQLPETLVRGMSAWIDGPTMFLVLTNGLLLLVGCLVDIGSAILILAPLLQPLAVAQGIDPVHFGVVMAVNLEIGYLTPPLGLNLVVAMIAFREDFWFICRAVLPFITILFAGLMAVTFVPQLSLFLIR
ncbi:MAG: TRAP transporter large permease [Gammaproteobacteria bacterium]|nr:TRAP transporter large permease [Gammaproteobacteria bacterium]